MEAGIPTHWLRERHVSAETGSGKRVYVRLWRRVCVGVCLSDVLASLACVCVSVHMRVTCSHLHVCVWLCIFESVCVCVSFRYVPQCTPALFPVHVCLVVPHPIPFRTGVFVCKADCYSGRNVTLHLTGIRGGQWEGDQANTNWWTVGALFIFITLSCLLPRALSVPWLKRAELSFKQ